PRRDRGRGAGWSAARAGGGAGPGREGGDPWVPAVALAPAPDPLPARTPLQRVRDGGGPPVRAGRRFPADRGPDPALQPRYPLWHNGSGAVAGVRTIPGSGRRSSPTG